MSIEKTNANHYFLPDYILTQHVIANFSEKDLVNFCMTNRKSRQLIINSLFNDKVQIENKSLEKIHNHYLFFWLSQLNFVHSDRSYYIELLEKWLTIQPASLWQKIIVHLLLKCLDTEKLPSLKYSHHLLSIITAVDKPLVQWLETFSLCSIEKEKDDFLSLVTLGIHLLKESKRPIENKFFICNFFNYFSETSFAHNRQLLLQEAFSKLENIKSSNDMDYIDNQEAYHSALHVLTVFSADIEESKITPVIHEILMPCLKGSVSIVRIAAAYSLEKIMERVSEQQCIKIIHTLFAQLENNFKKSEGFTGHIEILNLLTKFFYTSIDFPAEKFIHFLIKSVQFNVSLSAHSFRQACFKTLCQLFYYLSPTQMQLISELFLMTLKAYGNIYLGKTTHKALAELATPKKENEITKLLINSFLDALPNAKLDSRLALLTGLSYFLAYLTTDQLMGYFNNLFEFFLDISANEEHEASNIIYATLKIIALHIDNQQMVSVTNFILAKITNGEKLAFCEIGIKLLALLAFKVPHNLVKTMIQQLIEYLNSDDLALNEAAIIALGNFLPHISPEQLDVIFDDLFNDKLDSEDEVIQEAAFQTLAKFIPYLKQNDKIKRIAIRVIDNLHNKNCVMCETTLTNLDKIPGWVIETEDVNYITTGILIHLRSQNIALYQAALSQLKWLSTYLTDAQKNDMMTILIQRTGHLKDVKVFEHTINVLFDFTKFLSDEQIQALKIIMNVENPAGLLSSANEKFSLINNFWEKFYALKLEKTLIKPTPIFPKTLIGNSFINHSLFFLPVRKHIDLANVENQPRLIQNIPQV